MSTYSPPKSLLQAIDPARFETPAVLKKLITANRQLAELKGVAASIPNQGILISTLGLQEAKESSAIENIVTTHDELFRDASPEAPGSAAAKEVRLYAHALQIGFSAVQETGLLTGNHIQEIQAVLEQSRTGYRKVAGTTLKDGAGRVIYTPPSPELLPDLMGDLERFINDNSLFDADPLVKMALIHHQFESIHPFYDGNGRTGRIINVLYLVKEKLLDIPVLYLSRAIVGSKADYYSKLQAVRERDAWEEWVLYMLDAVEKTAAEGITTIQGIKSLLLEYKHRIREKHRFYSQDLINNLFSFPYTKIDFVQHDLKVSRLTATRYLDALADDGLLRKSKLGRNNYYINEPLFRILTGEAPPVGE
ncbi:Fic family protein [Stenotrophobium rhamnosiphilum]|uniref:Protein adenylyltransferase n=1 Tax=Stenotrophobium rhamnosiphilum TaxID=2029166 RepID=A0A2T5MFM4_9GAMM|nr:Fic family protein [Stenotrophobium rhamnosiphilum]PTU31360.1 addiction module protein [Stenotrophobium rhamnosiphilum]